MEWQLRRVAHKKKDRLHSLVQKSFLSNNSSHNWTNIDANAQVEVSSWIINIVRDESIDHVQSKMTQMGYFFDLGVFVGVGSHHICNQFDKLRRLRKGRRWDQKNNIFLLKIIDNLWWLLTAISYRLHFVEVVSIVKRRRRDKKDERWRNIRYM